MSRLKHTKYNFSSLVSALNPSTVMTVYGIKLKNSRNVSKQVFMLWLNGTKSESQWKRTESSIVIVVILIVYYLFVMID